MRRLKGAVANSSAAVAWKTGQGAARLVAADTLLDDGGARCNRDDMMGSNEFRNWNDVIRHAGSGMKQRMMAEEIR